MSHTQLAEQARAGDRRALARLLSLLESSGGGTTFLDSLGEPCPRIGVTGPPGSGKSSLINALIAEFRALGRTVAVVAVDPSSPVTGGALLGDRLRMQGHVDDDGVYVRSVASRGHLGGLAEAAGPMIGALSRIGFDLVLVETVGVGQSEVEVMDHVDLVVLVVGPGWGDEVQADKAGVMEIADLVVVNKTDRSGADEVRAALHASGVETSSTSALTGEGVPDLVRRLLDAVGAA